MDLANSKSDETMQWAGITGAIATVAVFAISQGLSYPLLSFILQRQGVSPAMIGVSAAMTPLGFIVSSFFIPALSRQFGAARLALACAALAALLLIAIATWQDGISESLDEAVADGELSPATPKHALMSLLRSITYGQQVLEVTEPHGAEAHLAVLDSILSPWRA